MSLMWMPAQITCRRPTAASARGTSAPLGAKISAASSVTAPARPKALPSRRPSCARHASCVSCPAE